MTTPLRTSQPQDAGLSTTPRGHTSSSRAAKTALLLGLLACLALYGCSVEFNSIPNMTQPTGTFGFDDAGELTFAADGCGTVTTKYGKTTVKMEAEDSQGEPIASLVAEHQIGASKDFSMKIELKARQRFSLRFEGVKAIEIKQGDDTVEQPYDFARGDYTLSVQGRAE